MDGALLLHADPTAVATILNAKNKWIQNPHEVWQRAKIGAASRLSLQSTSAERKLHETNVYKQGRLPSSRLLALKDRSDTPSDARKDSNWPRTVTKRADQEHRAKSINESRTKWRQDSEHNHALGRVPWGLADSGTEFAVAMDQSHDGEEWHQKWYTQAI